MRQSPPNPNPLARGEEIPAEPSSTLRQRLEHVLSEGRPTEQLLRALVELEPLQALNWLLTEEGEARATLANVELVRLLDALVAATAGAAETGAAERVLALLERYADVVSVSALVSLAGRLNAKARPQRLGWLVQQALTRDAMDPRLLRLASEIAAARGETEAAHDLLNRLGRAEPTPGTLHHVRRTRAALPPRSTPPVRAALLSSFTLDALLPHLDLECHELGLTPEFYVAPFNSWVREVIEPESGLWRFEPEIAFLAVSIDDLVPGLAGLLDEAVLAAAGAEAVERVAQVAREFAQRSNAVLVVHSFHSAFRDPAGVLDGRLSVSRGRWLAELNRRLAESLDALPRAYLLDMGELLLHRPGGAPENPKMRHLASMRIGDQVLGEVARAYARYLAPLKGLTRKCIVLDLDNTLWGGIVGEDGPHGIRLGDTSPGSEYKEFQRFLQSLSERGFLLAINSKNNAEDALEVIRSHPEMLLREDAFSAMRINWNAKPDNLLSLAEELNIGVDSFVFLDDNPKERELMRQTLPQVLTPELPTDPALYRQSVELLPQLQVLAVTDEDRQRAGMYRANRQREQVRVSVTSLKDYLRSLAIHIEVAPARADTLPRIHQLFSRTNQFNLTTRRYELAELTRLAADPAWQLLSVRARDRFGEHGLVATALVRTGEDWVIDSLLMSCRVIGYGIETALLAAIAASARQQGARSLIGLFIPSAKNKPAADFYARHGFSEEAGAGDESRWRLSFEEDAAVEHPDWISIDRDGA